MFGKCDDVMQHQLKIKSTNQLTDQPINQPTPPPKKKKNNNNKPPPPKKKKTPNNKQTKQKTPKINK